MSLPPLTDLDPDTTIPLVRDVRLPLYDLERESDVLTGELFPR